MSAQLHLVKPRYVNRSVPVRPPNSELRTREYLTPAEVEKLMKEARQGRYGHRDATLILIGFRHGLRASEICDLEWSQVEFGRSACLHVRRKKNGKPCVHPLRGDEIAASGVNGPPPFGGKNVAAVRERESSRQAHWRARRLRLSGSRAHR